MEIHSVLLVSAVVVSSSYKVDGKTSRMCLASVPTVTYVPRCPTTEEDFRMAERRKSCLDIKQNCADITKFKYHCVINEYGNQSLEVCAPTWYISGFCTEYNVKGRVIQDHYRKDCTTFNKHPCPSRYLSTDSYKYSECFLSSNLNSNLRLEDGISPTDSGGTFLIIDILLGILIIIELCVCIWLLYRFKRKDIRQILNCCMKDKRAPYDVNGSESSWRSYNSLESTEEYTAGNTTDPEHIPPSLPERIKDNHKEKISTTTACIDNRGRDGITCNYENNGGFVKKMVKQFDGNRRFNMDTQSEDGIYQDCEATEMKYNYADTG